MSDLFMQSIVEKLEGMELFLKAHFTDKPQPVDLSPVLSAINAFKNELITKYSGQTLDTKTQAEVNQNMRVLLQQLQLPRKDTIEHKHHLHKGVWVLIGLFVTCFLLGWGWLASHQAFETLQANDIKYRSLKISGNKSVLKLCEYTDSLYRKDAGVFSAGVEQEEQRLIEQAELIRLAGENEKEAKTLKDRAGSIIRKP